MQLEAQLDEERRARRDQFEQLQSVVSMLQGAQKDLAASRQLMGERLVRLDEAQAEKIRHLEETVNQLGKQRGGGVAPNTNADLVESHKMEMERQRRDHEAHTQTHVHDTHTHTHAHKHTHAPHPRAHTPTHAPHTHAHTTHSHMHTQTHRRTAWSTNCTRSTCTVRSWS